MSNPDSPIADTFIAAHSDRFCVPGQAGSFTCSGLSSPRPIRRVIVHTVGIPSDASLSGVQKAIRNHQRPGRQAASHYYIDRDGSITQMVLEQNVAFHTPGANSDSIGIEHPDVCNAPAPLTKEVYERSAALVRDIAARNGFIPTEATVAGHDSVAGNHGDPGPYWDWEYYRLLLSWSGQSVETKPFRHVNTVEGKSPTSGWQVKNRRQIPDDQCASTKDSYGAQFWQRQPDPQGAAAKFSLLIPDPGFYSVALWWPDVSGANPAKNIDILVQEARSPQNTLASESVSVNQRVNFGRWNSVGGGFRVDSIPIELLVHIRSDSLQPGWILADGVRALRIGS